MSWISEAYKKSGLRKIYEKNKSGILKTGVGLGTGGIGAVIANQMEKKKEGAKNAIKEQNEKKALNERNLDQFLDSIAGGGTPNAGGMTTGPGPTLPSMNPGPNTPELVDPALQGVPTTGGMSTAPGEATHDQNRLLDEAAFQKKFQQEFAESSKAERAKMLQEYSDLIATQQNRLLDENNPALLEDLNTRGLLRSSELGNAMSRERSKAAAILAEQVGLQGLQDREANLGDRSKIEDQYNQGRYGAIQRGMSLEDFVRQTKAAQLTGQVLAPRAATTPSAKGGSALQGAMSGAAAGTAVAPGYGTAVGAGVGAVAGGQLGSK